MGNQHSSLHSSHKPKKNVRWKSAGTPAVPGRPEIIPFSSDEEPNAITLKWAPSAYDGGAPLQGYQVECNRLGSRDWIRTAPPVVQRPELVLTGLEPPYRYQFRVAAVNIVGCSQYSELSDVLNISSDRVHQPPIFLQSLEDVTSLENETTEFKVTFTGTPVPTIAWFKDDYEIFSSRRTAITTNETSSVLIFHQTLASDEGEIKCTATNRAGHAVLKAKLSLEATPKLRYPRQYEDGLLYEVNETIFLKTSVVGKPTPDVEWRHNGIQVVANDRMEITNAPKFSILKIHAAKRSDRGEYQIHAKNSIGEDTAAFLVTVTAPPDPPQRVSVTRQVDKSVTLDWEPPEDDGGCRIGNYVVEYYRTGWNVWLKATTSRKTNATLFDLIEGSEYKFRVKAESPYGMSAPSVESPHVKIPGRAVDMEFLAVESRIINDVLTREDGQEPTVSPAPRRKRLQTSPTTSEPVKRRPNSSPIRNNSGSNEFMIVLYPESERSSQKAEKRKSFQLDLEDALSPPPISLSAPDLSTRNIMPFKALRNAVSSTELLHEQAMARFYKVVAMKEEQKQKEDTKTPIKDEINNDIPYHNNDQYLPKEDGKSMDTIHDFRSFNLDEKTPKESSNPENQNFNNNPEIFIKTDSTEDKEYKYNSEQEIQNTDVIDNRWHNISFDDDYTASTVSTDYSDDDEGSLNGEMERESQIFNEDEIYNPRNKLIRPSPIKETEEESNSEPEIPKLLPLPDPNFVPKPILKKREPEKIKKEATILKSDIGTSPKRPKKELKMTILKKITKMPVQKSFPFPRIINKKESSKIPEKNVQYSKPRHENQVEKEDNKISDEGKTVIDYYTNIVKEYGSQKKTAPPLYLNTDDLKIVAEQQQKQRESKEIPENKATKANKFLITDLASVKTTSKSKITETKKSNINSTPKHSAPKHVNNKSFTKFSANSLNKSKTIKTQIIPNNSETGTQQILLKTTERATIVIPINYQELEQQAKITVRSAIDYTVDLCLLLLAFWVYFFKDERLAIPFLILIIYRQLQETFTSNLPEWVKDRTPNCLKKTS